MAIVLFSGGLDSTVALWWAAQNYGGPQHAISFFYGQRHAVELQAARKILEAAPVKSHIFASVNGIGLGLHGALVDHDAQLVATDPDGNAFLPGRNILFLTLAALRSAVIKDYTLIVGCNADDAAGFPDCRYHAILAMQSALTLGLGVPAQVVAPFITDTKSRVISAARSLGSDCWAAIGKSWSCYEGGVMPCGACRACVVRAEAFRVAGETDPAL